jgi:hypothetical protein
MGEATMVDQIQAELALKGETVSPRVMWEAYKRDNPEWRDAWWRRTMRASFKELRGTVPDDAEDGRTWDIPLAAPWNSETDTHAEPAGLDVPMKRDAALEIARRMPLIEVMNSAAKSAADLQCLTLFDWEPEPGRLYSCYLAGAIERNGVPENGIQKFSRIIGVTFISELVKGSPGRPPITEAMRLSVGGGDPRRLEGDASKLTAAELEQFWIDLDIFLKPAGEIHPIEQTPKKSMAPAAVPSKATDRQKRLLLGGMARVDRDAYAMTFMIGGRGLPRTWEGVPIMEHLVEEEVVRLQEQMGDVELDPKGPLRKRFRRDGYVIELAPAAKKALREREGRTGFREINPKDGREYLIKRFTRPGGWMEIGISWYGSAILMFKSARDKSKKQAEEILEKLDKNPLLFEDLSERRREAAERHVQMISSLDDAGVLFADLISGFGVLGENPSYVPAVELRSLLGCENDPNGHARVMGALEALSNLSCYLNAKGEESAEGRSPLVTEYLFKGGGAGDHKDGFYYVGLGHTAIGSLKAFEMPGGPQDKEAAVFNFFRPAKELTASPNYVQFERLIWRFADISGFSKPQKAVLGWMASNITLNMDGARKGRYGIQVKSFAPNASEERVYTKQFCPRLPAGDYVCALGHFAKSRNAECGFKLATIMKEMRPAPSSKEAMAAIAGVVESLSGHIAIRCKGSGEQWNSEPT